MEYFSMRDLRSPKEIREKLSQEGELVLTNNGAPTALVIGVDETNLEETISAFRQAKTMRLVNSMRVQSVRGGLDQLGLDDINAEIDAAREDGVDG